MDIKETFESIYDRIKERIGSPFFGSAVLSWPLINYKFLVTCLSEGKFIEKVYFIETYVYPTTYTRLWQMVALPAFVGLFYTLIYPLLDIALTAASKKIFAWKQWVVLKVERKIPIDSMEQAAFFAAYDLNVKRLESAFADQTKRHMEQYAERGAALNDLTGRLKTQCLRRLAEETGLEPQHIEMIVGIETFVLDQPLEPGGASFKVHACRSTRMRALIPIIEQLNQKTTPDPIHDRVANLPALSQSLNLSEAQLLDAMELLQAMGLVTLGGPEAARTIGVAEAFRLERALQNLRHIFV